MVPVLQDEKQEGIIYIPKVEKVWNLNLYKIYDLSIEKIEQSGKLLLKCRIKDLTAYYGKMVANQQMRNEKAIKEQIEKN